MHICYIVAWYDRVSLRYGYLIRTVRVPIPNTGTQVSTPLAVTCQGFSRGNEPLKSNAFKARDSQCLGRAPHDHFWPAGERI